MFRRGGITSQALRGLLTVISGIERLLIYLFIFYEDLLN